MNTLAFSFKTIPDIDAGRRLYGDAESMAQLSEQDVAKVMWLRHDQIPDRPHLSHLPLEPYAQKIISISLFLDDGQQCELHTLGLPQHNEANLLRTWLTRVAEERTLLTWGRAHLQNILQMRLLNQHLAAPMYWSRYVDNKQSWLDLRALLLPQHTDHAYTLNEIGRFLNISAPTVLDELAVWDAYKKQDFALIHQSSTEEVCALHALHLHWLHSAGKLSDSTFQAAQARYLAVCDHQ
jgi:predicted PolB exonuclease-like 3'-5' exonuclease